MTKERILHDPKILASVLRYEPTTGEFFWKVSDTIKYNIGDSACKYDTAGYLVIVYKGAKYQAHRLAWLYMTGSLPENLVDHINGTRDDNRFENLRDVTHSVNMKNKKTYKNNTTGMTGVYSRGGKYAARLMIDKESIWLGFHDTPEKAHEAYLECKAKRIFIPEATGQLNLF